MPYDSLMQALDCLTLGTAVAHAAAIDEGPGHKASNVQQGKGQITADLTLAGGACNAFGDEVKDLRLLVEYETEQ